MRSRGPPSCRAGVLQGYPRHVPAPVVLLSPQRRRPNLGTVLAMMGAEGPFAVITAGWEEREGEYDDLVAHLGQEVTNLRLYGRLEEAFAQDRNLAAAYRERRTLLREQAELYRLRLATLCGAWHDLPRHHVRPELVEVERASVLQSIRELDAHQAGRVGEIVREFDEAWHPAERPSLARHVDEVRKAALDAEGILVAGGNVAVLLNRLRVFGMDRWLRERPVFAWSAGAMALCERVVLFHDRPPQGAGHPEVLDAGLGLVAGIAPLPHGEERLDLADRERVSLFAQRCAPAVPTLLEQGAAMAWNGRAWRTVVGRPRRLAHDGSVEEVP